MRRSTAILQLALIVLLLAVRVHGAQAEPLGYISAEIRFGIDRIYRSDPAIGYFTALPLIVSHGERVGNFSSDDYLDALLFAIVDEDGSLGSASRIGAASGSGPFGPSSHVSSGAGIMIDDVVISSTTPGIFYAPLSLNLDIHGSLRTNTIRGEATSGVGVAGSVQQPQCCGLPELGGGFQAHINILSEVRVFEPSATTRVRRSGLFAADSDFEETISLGSSAEIEINQRLTSPSYRLRLNTPFKVLLQLSTGVETIQAENSVTYVSSADADFAHSLRFPGDGPVFNLPLDVTANSRDGRIVDNRFVGVSPPPPADTTAPPRARPSRRRPTPPAGTTPTSR